MWTQNIRPLAEEEVTALRSRWFRGATVLGWATRKKHGLGLIDPAGEVDAANIVVVVELHLAGIWSWQSRILHANRYSNAGHHWDYAERVGEGKFVLHDTHGFRTDRLDADAVAGVIRDKVSVVHMYPNRYHRGLLARQVDPVRRSPSR